MSKSTICAADMPVTLDVEVLDKSVPISMPAKQWAEMLGVPWQTVRLRRYRGSNWRDSLRPGNRQNLFNAMGR